MPDNNPFKKYSPSIKKRWRTTAKRTARLKPFRSREATALRDAKIAIEDGDENAEIHHELEIVLLIGKGGKARSTNDANSFICGYALGIDLTNRPLQDSLKNKQLPWLLSKSFVGSAIVSKFEKKEIIEDFWLKINGEEKQRGNKNQMIFNIQDLVYYLSNKIPLMIGDIIFTGTPNVVGPITIGDRIEIGYGQKYINKLIVKN